MILFTEEIQVDDSIVNRNLTKNDFKYVSLVHVILSNETEILDPQVIQKIALVLCS